MLCQVNCELGIFTIVLAKYSLEFLSLFYFTFNQPPSSRKIAMNQLVQYKNILKTNIIHAI